MSSDGHGDRVTRATVRADGPTQSSGEIKAQQARTARGLGPVPVLTRFVPVLPENREGNPLFQASLNLPVAVVQLLCPVEALHAWKAVPFPPAI